MTCQHFSGSMTHVETGKHQGEMPSELASNIHCFDKYLQNIMANNYLSFNRSLLAMAALQALPLSLFAQNTGEKPNILYIMCDDHAIQAISLRQCHLPTGAYPKYRPTCRKGMKFNEAFVENSLSTPSHCLSDDRPLQSSERTAHAGRGHRFHQNLL